MTLDLAVDLLSRCLSESDATVRLELIRQFEEVPMDPKDVHDDHVLDVLATARLDLSYYEPREEWREDRSLYDDAELDRRLWEILRDLGQTEADLLAAGHSLPNPEPSTWQRLVRRMGRRVD
jgi:hypothetical protein